jgi:hypothetical protein
MCVYVYEKSTIKPPKNCLKRGRRKEEGGLRKSNIEEVNLIKVLYMQVVNITNDTPLYN